MVEERALTVQSWQWRKRAIAKRPIDAEQINALLSKTLRQIENEFDGEVPSRAIAGCNHAKTQKCGWSRMA